MLKLGLSLYFLYLNVLFCCASEINLHQTGNPEELIITEVVSDQTFAHNQNVTLWKSISLKNECYFVGLMSTGIVVVTAKLDSDKSILVTQENVVELNLNLTNLEVFEYWNDFEQKLEAIVVVASKGVTPDLLWFKVTNRTLNQFWTLHVHKNVTHFQYFNFEYKHKLVLISKSEFNSVSVDLYEFSLNHNNYTFWLSQVWSLPGPAYTTAVNTYGPNLYLSIPQTRLGEIFVYKFIGGGFQLHHNITSKRVTQVISFKIGHKSFLVFNGDSAGVYQFTKSGIVPEVIDRLNMQDVNFWLPVPMKTYRDEVLLLVQHSLEHDTHNSHFLELAVYDFHKQQFVVHEETLCSFSGENRTGFSCMNDQEAGTGITGSSFWSLGKLFGVIVPHRKTSALFKIHAIFKEVSNPHEVQIENFITMQKELQEMIAEHDSAIKELRDRLENRLKPNETNYVSGYWKIENVSVPVLHENKQASGISSGSLRNDEEIDVDELLKEAREVFKQIDEFQTQLSDIIIINETNNDFNELIINGEIEIIGESNFKDLVLEKLNDELVNEVFDDLVRNGNVTEIFGHKTFTNLHVGNLTFDNINGMRVEDLIFDHGKVDESRNEVLGAGSPQARQDLKDPIEVDRIQVEEDTQTGHADGPSTTTHFKADLENSNMLNLDNLELDFLKISFNISAENVNGENFDDFLRELCLVNIDTDIPETLTITGNVVAEEIQIEFLNDLKFPEEYLLQNAPHALVNATKIFNSPLTIDELFIAGKINDLKTSEIMTLRKNQTFSGTYTFEDLEVTNQFNFADITGTYLNKFLRNAMINETNQVKAKVSFKYLEVDGDVIISNKLNGNDLESIFNNVVYEDEGHVEINSVKSFPEGFTVVGGLKVLSNTINDTPLDLFVTKNTEQIIEIPTLNGNVVFENLNLGGLFGGVNVTKLDAESVKLSGQQFVSSTLVFDNQNENFIDLSTTKLIVKKTLNNLTASNYFFASSDSRLIRSESLVFENIEANKVSVEGSVSGELVGFSLKDFDSRRLSFTRDQTITGKYNIQKLEADSLTSNFINGEPYEKVFEPEYYVDVISKMLFDGKLEVKNLHVNGSVFARSANGQDLDFLKNCLWTNKENNFDKAIFKGDVVIKDLSLIVINEIDFKFFLDSLIYKTEKDLVIQDFKAFTNGFHVVRMINSERLNGIRVDDIFTKRGNQEIFGPLNIYGNVHINFDTEVAENLNEFSMDYLTKTYQFNDNTIIINEDVVFNRLQYVEKLIVENSINERNVQEFLSEIVYKTENAKLEGRIIFENNVEITHNLNIGETINGVDLSEFAEDIVYINSNDIIDGIVIFTQPVTIEEELKVETSLETNYLMGIDLNTWKNNAVYINRGLIPGTLSFESVKVNGEVSLKYINDIDLNNLIPLSTDQVINQQVSFSELTSYYDLPVGNLVNGYNLQQEYENSILTTTSGHYISSRITFNGNVLVRDNLEVEGLVNGADLRRIVTTNTDQNLTAYFNLDGKVVLNSNLIVFGTVNEINFQDWQARSVKLYSPEVQNIDDHWVIDGGDMTFLQDVVGGGTIDGIDVRELADLYQEKRLEKFSTENSLMTTYVSTCKEINTLLKAAETQVYFFKYFEHLQKIEFTEPIENVHQFKAGNQHFFVITESGTCNSLLFKWNGRGFQVLYQFHSGNVAQIISVYDGDLVFLVTRSHMNASCDISGTNVWKFEPEDNLKVLYKLEDYELLQDSLVPGTFYGLIGNTVIEHRLTTVIETTIKGYMKWTLNSETGNLAFIPRGLGTGLALTNGRKLFRLIREEPVVDEAYGYETEAYLIGRVLEEYNTHIPGRFSQLLVVGVGVAGRKRSLAALAYHEDVNVKGRFDFIKIYEDILKGELFYKIPTYKPSSLISIEFGNNGESFLVFLEDGKVLQVYEYKGIEGFKYRDTIKIPGLKLISMNLPMAADVNGATVLGIIDHNKLTTIRAVMTGNQIKLEEPTCEL